MPMPRINPLNFAITFVLIVVTLTALSVSSASRSSENALGVVLAAPASEARISTISCDPESAEDFGEEVSKNCIEQQETIEAVRVTPASDTEPPTVKITSPGNGAGLSGITTISARAFDIFGISKVEFYVDGLLITTDTVVPYAVKWDTSSTSEGNHEISTKAYDASGKTSSDSATVTVKQGSTKPNILVLMTDDQDAASIEVMTKVNSLLASRGTTFSNFVVSFSLCCPSKSTLLSGQYAHNHGVKENSPANGGGYSKFNSANALPVWLQKSGYYTAHIGRYLNGYGTDDTNPSDGIPANREVPLGWTEWGASVDPSTVRFYNYTLNENGVPVLYKEYQTDVYAQKATDFIEKRASEGTPFFLSVWFFAPHYSSPRPAKYSPEPASRHKGLFAEKPFLIKPSFNEADFSDKPLSRQKRLLTSIEIRQIKKSYAYRLESLLAVDEAVEKIINKLEATGQLNNTVIIFSSDNGWLQGEHRELPEKRGYYEESIKVPFIVYMPGIDKQVIDKAVSNIDIAPTIVELAGASAGLTMDGRSLVQLIKQPESEWRLGTLIEDFSRGRPNSFAIRTDKYKYVNIISENVQEQLFDRYLDPYEINSVHNSPEYKNIKNQLKQKLDTLRTCAGDSCWLISDTCFNPFAEICDGIDNDCDGKVDEDFNVGASCSAGVGACQKQGTYVCSPDKLSTICNAQPGQPTGEICDNIDNDCDGQIDEDFNVGESCTIENGVCIANSIYVCNLDGSGTVCTLPAELCDGIDNNCNDETDEGFNVGQECSAGTGACLANGAYVCNIDGSGTICSAVPGQPSTEICDNIDNDCNSQIDDLQPLTCGIGACQNTVNACVNGNDNACIPLNPSLEVCNDNLDNDCDGLTDEGCTPIIKTFTSIASKDGYAAASRYSTSGAYINIGNTDKGVQRAFLYFDTSVIPQNAVVQSAKLKIHGINFAKTACTKTGNIDIVSCSFYPLSASDFNACNSATASYVNLPEAGGAQIVSTNIDASLVSKGGYTQLLLKSQDEACSSGTSGNYARICTDGGEWSCTDSTKPLLEVAYIE